MKTKTRILFVNYCFAVIAALLLYLWFAGNNGVALGLVILLVFAVSAIGLILKQEWARRLIVAVSVFGFVFNLYEMLFVVQAVDLLSLTFAAVAVAAVAVYRVSYVRRFYELGFKVPDWEILLVDDDKTFLRLMRANFLREGLRIYTVDTGEKGIALARHKKFDLIILDVVLPGIKGREVCDLLKEESKTQDTPVIFLTVKHEQADIKAEMEAGAVLHMTKPVDFRRLFEEITKILGS